MSEVHQSTDPIARVNELQRRIHAGEEVSAEEMSAVLAELRRGRKTTHETGEAKATKKKSVSLPMDLNTLFDPPTPKAPE